MLEGEKKVVIQFLETFLPALGMHPLNRWIIFARSKLLERFPAH